MTITLVLEDGTGKVNSNTYNTGDQITQYASDRGIVLDTPVEILAIKSKDVLESYDYLGIKTTKTQALAFPRAIYTSRGGTYNQLTSMLIDGYPLESNEIPNRLKKAQCEICLAIDGGFDPTEVLDRTVTEEQIGLLKVKYADTPYNQKENDSFKLPLVDKLLAPLLEDTGSSSVVPLYRS